MTIDEAIKILSSNGLCPSDTTWGDYIKAVNLGGEALKLYMALKATGGLPKRFSGIGETEE